MSSFHLTIVTPERVFYDGEVASLIAPGGDGYLGVLAHHAPLLTTLLPGQLTYALQAGERREFAIGSGFMHVYQNRVTLLTESVRPA